ncbi:hypothetical protein JCM19233_6157 [Vibrio astriarenae]|nr:hypothetical protein JCM19233_6157 [Vibrio sp. C7]
MAVSKAAPINHASHVVCGCDTNSAAIITVIKVMAWIGSTKVKYLCFEHRIVSYSPLAFLLP